MKITIGEKFKLLRELAGKTETEVADHMKLSLQSYRKHEDDFLYPSDQQITKIGKLYGLTYEEVIAVGEE